MATPTATTTQRTACGGVKRATVAADGETITVHILLTFRKRGGRKLVVTPDGAAWAPRPRVDNAMVKALARAFRWGRCWTRACTRRWRIWRERRGGAVLHESRPQTDTARAGCGEAILDGRQPAEPQLNDLSMRLPLDWHIQTSLYYSPRLDERLPQRPVPGLASPPQQSQAGEVTIAAIRRANPSKPARSGRRRQFESLVPSES